MQCPSCSAPTIVVATSEGHGASPIRRRRQCSACGLKFATSEALSLVVIRRKGVTEPYSRQAVITGVRRAAQGNVHVVNALARQGRLRQRLGRPPTGHLPNSLRLEPSTSGGWSPFSLASASGRG
ncbi:hypothetical protein [Streptomyces sp. NPDC002328]|uniref:NrdR family transcriptional regulator n=1 Tax=Streptomyces sp. NPDC002328 TaxID=3364642 RepID=UPI0036B61843